MPLTDLEVQLLRRLAVDYENTQTLASDIQRESGRAVSEQQMSVALQSLVLAGLANKYVFNQRSQKFLLIGGNAIVAESQWWFFATDSGRDEFHRRAG